jgi:hypothetical protein
MRLAPATICGPKRACPARGPTGPGNVRLPARKARRCMGTACYKRCSATQGPAFSRVRPSTEPVSLVVTLMAHGGPWHAIGVAFGCDERPVAGWLGRAGGPGQAVQASCVEPPRDLGPVPADESRVPQQGGVVWRWRGGSRGGCGGPGRAARRVRCP